jgi:hypothetical protein
VGDHSIPRTLSVQVLESHPLIPDFLTIADARTSVVHPDWPAAAFPGNPGSRPLLRPGRPLGDPDRNFADQPDDAWAGEKVPGWGAETRSP